MGNLDSLFASTGKPEPDLAIHSSSILDALVSWFPPHVHPR